MSTRHPFKQRTAFRGEIQVGGSFAPAGTGAVTAVRGTGFTVARTSAGLFTVTLDKVFPSLVRAYVMIQMASATDISPQLGLVDLATARTIQIRTIVAAVVTDIAADANNRVHFEFTFRDTAMST
jgi:hypothetical protein